MVKILLTSWDYWLLHPTMDTNGWKINLNNFFLYCLFFYFFLSRGLISNIVTLQIFPQLAQHQDQLQFVERNTLRSWRLLMRQPFCSVELIICVMLRPFTLPALFGKCFNWIKLYASETLCQHVRVPSGVTAQCVCTHTHQNMKPTFRWFFFFSSFSFQTSFIVAESIAGRGEVTRHKPNWFSALDSNFSNCRSQTDFYYSFLVWQKKRSPNKPGADCSCWISDDFTLGVNLQYFCRSSYLNLK